MYKALVENKVINLLDKKIQYRRNDLKKEEVHDKLRCPVCNQKVILNWAKNPIRVPHFKHKLKNDCIYGSGETALHREGKRKLFNYFNSLLGHKTECIDVEHFLPQTRQIADIYIKFHSGTEWVIEYQRSNVSPEEIYERRKKYRDLNIKDIWIVGENMIKDVSLAICSVSHTGQAILEANRFSKGNLITFEPEDNLVKIFRELDKQNGRSYTFEKLFEYNLEEISFNLKGEAFCLEDYQEVSIPAQESGREGITYLMPVVELNKSNLSGPYFNVKFNQENDSKNEFKSHFIIPAHLHKYIPVEMKDVEIPFSLIYHHKEPFEEPFISVKGIYPYRWKKPLTQKREDKVTPEFLDLTPTRGFLRMALLDIYESKYQTSEEFKKGIRLIEEGTSFPFYTENHFLLKNGLLKKPILKSDLHKKIDLKDCLLVFLRIMNVPATRSNCESIALKEKVVSHEELNLPFKNALIAILTKRVKQRIETSPLYHHAYTEKRSIFD